MDLAKIIQHQQWAAMWSWVARSDMARAERSPAWHRHHAQNLHSACLAQEYAAHHYAIARGLVIRG